MLLLLPIVVLFVAIVENHIFELLCRMQSVEIGRATTFCVGGNLEIAHRPCMEASSSLVELQTLDKARRASAQHTRFQE